MRFLRTAKIREVVQVSHGVLGGLVPQPLLFVSAHLETTGFDLGGLDLRQHDFREFRVLARTGRILRDGGHLEGSRRAIAGNLERDDALDHILALANRNDPLVVAGRKFGALQIGQIRELLGLSSHHIFAPAGDTAGSALARLAGQSAFERQGHTRRISMLISMGAPWISGYSRK